MAVFLASRAAPCWHTTRAAAVKGLRSRVIRSSLNGLIRHWTIREWNEPLVADAPG